MLHRADSATAIFKKMALIGSVGFYHDNCTTSNDKYTYKPAVHDAVFDPANKPDQAAVPPTCSLDDARIGEICDER